MDEDGSMSSAQASLPASGVTGESPGLSSSRDYRDIDAMCTDWTDEKHNTYLNSVEASFLSQLYSSEYCSSDLLGCQPITQRERPSGSKPNTKSSGQFKVLREGCWRKLYFDRAGDEVNTENITQLLCKNPWVQHFRSPVICREGQLKSSDKNGVIGTNGETIVSESERSSEPLIFRQDAIDKVSDLNFLDTDTNVQLNATNRKKRMRSPTTPNQR